MLRDGAARLQPALLLAPAHDRRLAAKRPEAEEATPILAHILDVGFAAADSIKVAGVEIRLLALAHVHIRVLDLLAVGQVRGEPLVQAGDDIRARVFEESVGSESAIVSIDTSPTARSSPAKQHATQPARSSPLAG